MAPPRTSTAPRQHTTATHHGTRPANQRRQAPHNTSHRGGGRGGGGCGRAGCGGGSSGDGGGAAQGAGDGGGGWRAYSARAPPQSANCQTRPAQCMSGRSLRRRARSHREPKHCPHTAARRSHAASQCCPSCGRRVDVHAAWARPQYARPHGRALAAIRALGWPRACVVRAAWCVVRGVACVRGESDAGNAGATQVTSTRRVVGNRAADELHDAARCAARDDPCATRARSTDEAALEEVLDLRGVRVRERVKVRVRV
jgi:hypothetical protein